MSYITFRPKISTIQAGLLLLQRPEGDSWALTAKLVAIGQDLGLHLDCSRWKVPSWERGLRKRLAWALYMQDKWGALVHGRPSHVNTCDWLVKPVTEDDFPERSADEDDEEGSTEVEKGRVLFSEMIRLTQILSEILATFYTLRAEEDFRHRRVEGVGWILEKAKPIQLRLKEWYAQLPECLKMENVKIRKLNSSGYLHLGYYATEMTLHRRMIQALTLEKDTSLRLICRSAAEARLAAATDFVSKLRPEFLQSFWHSSSKYSFALVGSFVSLLWATAVSKQDAEAYKQKLEDYRWTLRLLSKGADILERALDMLAAPTAVLVKAIPEKGPPVEMLNRETESPLKEESEAEDADEQAVVHEEYSFGPTPATFPEGTPDLSWPGLQDGMSNFYSLPDAVDANFLHPFMDTDETIE